MGSRTLPPTPTNAPAHDYAPGTPARAELEAALDAMASEPREAPCVIGGVDIRTGDTFDLFAPHDHTLKLGVAHAGGTEEVRAAIQSASNAKRNWAGLPWERRAAIFLRVADRLETDWRMRLNAATMLHQSKTCIQAEIDAACELIDFLRFNVHFYSQIISEQPVQAPHVWNRLDYRPLEGFVLAMTPFNFTAIAGNLPTAPALCGNTVVWKPSEKQALSAAYLMDLFRECGLPDGVINLVHGDGAMAADVAMSHTDFAGLHFTGSATVFRELWRKVGNNIDAYATYPRVVGETGGKDFVVAHESADPTALTTALIRGAFEYQGQKCSAASRAYLPRSLWEDGLREQLASEVQQITMGDVRDFSNFMGAVIDEVAFRRHAEALERAAEDPLIEVLAGGTADQALGWFVEPTVLVTEDPLHEFMHREFFGPILTVFVYEDGDWDDTLRLVDATSPYGLTGAVWADDPQVIARATARLRQAAGNFYINDKPTGSIVGQQPFGGARASGTNDKAGSSQNLLRWLSTRSIKEQGAAPTEWRHPHMGS